MVIGAPGGRDTIQDATALTDWLSHFRMYYFRMYYGSEFTSRAFDAWAYSRDVRLDFIQPGKPDQNGFIESFNGTFRDDCLNLHWFLSLERARLTIEVWRRDYNEIRPHGSLGEQTPAEFLAAFTPEPRTAQQPEGVLE